MLHSTSSSILGNEALRDDEWADAVACGEGADYETSTDLGNGSALDLEREDGSEEGELEIANEVGKYDHEEFQGLHQLQMRAS